jgi:hypothetical protein
MNRLDHGFWVFLRLPKVDRPIVIKGIGTFENNVIDRGHAVDISVALIVLE